MAISDAIIRMVKYDPELIPDAWIGNVPAAAEVAPAVLDLRRFSPYLVSLTSIHAFPFAAVQLRARYDDIRLDENTFAMIRDVVPPAAGVTPALPGAWFLTAKQYLYLNLLGIAGMAGYPVSYSVWARKPTIAHKLAHGISLTAEEQALSDKLGIANSVDKGVLPLPISQQIEREYYVLGEETKARTINIAVAATDYIIENLYARANEIIVLTRIAAAPGTVAQAIQIIVDRDNDPNYATVPAYPLSLIVGGEVPCFIPALHEIILHTTATVAPGPTQFRYTIKRIRLNNILRVRFGIIAPSEAPGDVGDKVLAGIL